MKNVKSVLVALTLAAFAATLAVAAEGGNPKKGKHLFKQDCKSCHSAGAAGGEVTPLSKTQAQWDRFFETDKHSKKPEAIKSIPEQDLKDIQQFLYDHAADSDQPQTCG